MNDINAKLIKSKCSNDYFWSIINLGYYIYKKTTFKINVKMFILILLFKKTIKSSVSTVESYNIKKPHGAPIKNDILNDNNILYTLKSWIDRKNNFKELICMIISNNFKNLVESNLSILFSDLYQFCLLKKTLIRSDTLENLLDDCNDKKLILELKEIEKTLIFNFLPFLKKFKMEIDAKKHFDPVNNFIDYIAASDNSLFNEFLILLRKYIICCRVEIAEKKIYNIPVNCENIKEILIKYNVFISSMIEIYCKIMLIFKSELFMKAICQIKLYNEKKTYTVSKFLRKIENLNLDLRNLSIIIYYNANKYNKIINNQIKNIRELFCNRVCLINACHLTNFAKIILFNAGITENLKLSNFDSNIILYYLSNNTNSLDFEETKNSMFECCKESFPGLKTLDVDLKKFECYQSVLNHIQIKIRIDVKLKKIENNNIEIDCEYKLIPTIIYDTSFTAAFENVLHQACKKIKLNSNKSKNKYIMDIIKKIGFFNIFNEKENLIYKHVSKKEGFYESLTMRFECYYNIDNEENCIIRKINMQLKTVYFRDINNKKKENKKYYLTTKEKILYFYPVTEKIETTQDKNAIDGVIRVYSFENYIYNPKTVELIKKSSILNDLMDRALDDERITEKLMLNTSNFINDWFEKDISYCSTPYTFFEVVPYKYVSNWMSYITFRYILRNIKTITKQNNDIIQSKIVEPLYELLRRYEIYSMAFDSVYDIKGTYGNYISNQDFIDLYNLYWSDTIKLENQKKMITLLLKKLPESEKLYWRFYKFDITFNQQKIGIDSINATRIDSSAITKSKLTELWNNLFKKHQVVRNNVRQNVLYKKIKSLSDELL